MVRLLLSEFKKNKRIKSIYIAVILVILYLSFTIFYTVNAVGLFDNFIYLYKFSLSYMNFLILPIILLSFTTTTFSNEYKSDTIKYLLTIPISRTKLFIAKLLYVLCNAFIFMCIVFLFTTLSGYFSRFQSSMNFYLVIRFFILCLISSFLVTVAITPISVITILTKGNSVTTNIIGSIYIITSFFLMKILQGFSTLSSITHIIWYKNFEGVHNNENILLMLLNVFIVFGFYLIASLKILKRQDL
ncbi:ABC transporter permease [Streptobacillus moniliformis]|uniref:ABC transporter permease n=1 Tax=Streptobacillus moniliformis TaxID=34105 RepID=UPI000AD286DD|nr:ABC transporter permease [Streptobacillus moniliformis]